MNLAVLSWLTGLLGFCSLVVGVALIHVPAACIVAGVLMVGYAYLLDRASAATRRRKE